jgi:hypothetical protein
MRIRVHAAAALIGLVAGSAWAQSRGSFQDVDGFTAITVTEVTSLTYTVSLGASPLVRVGGIDYPVTAVFGFWSLSDDFDFTTATGSNFDVWAFHRNSASTGDIAGWKTNPNTGILPGGNQSFAYTALTSSQRERFGLHISTAEVVPGQQGLTFYATGPTIPAPASAGVLAGAGLVAVRRRRR